MTAGVGIILQARMGSSRLPGKVVRPLAGKPLFQRVIERLRKVRAAQTLVLATSDLPQEAPLIELARKLGVPVFRGSEADVLDRYYRCAKEFGLRSIVRATGDNPFVDPEECERLIQFFESEKLEYATSFPDFGSGLPIGIGTEIFSFDALERSWKEGVKPHHREHVNEYLQENPAIFKQSTLRAPPAKSAPQVRLTVDTPEDFELAERLLVRYRAECAGDEPPTEWLVNASK